MRIKRLISILAILALIISMLTFAACNDKNEEQSPNDSDSVADSGSDSSEADSGNDNAGKEPDQEIQVPEGSILLDKDYVIVYDADIKGLDAGAMAISSLIKGMHKLQLAVYADTYAPANSTKRIIIGDTGDDISAVKAKINAENDFIVDLCGDDVVLYATADNLYDYLIEVALNDVFTRQRPIIGSADSLIYHNSRYKDTNYAQFLQEKNGSFNRDALLDLFEARTFNASDGTALQYRIYIPSNCETGKTPLLLYMHGAGERGTDNVSQLSTIMPNAFSFEDSPYTDAIIIVPQCPDTVINGQRQQWVDTPWINGNYRVDAIPESNELAAVVELIDEIGEIYKPDKDRYYVMGLSMGGFATWDLIMRHTDLFAAALPICGGSDPTQAYKLKDFPIWTVHGTLDATVPYSATVAMSRAMTAAGASNFTFTPLEGIKHNAWDTVAQDVRFGEWLFAQRRVSAQ